MLLYLDRTRNSVHSSSFSLPLTFFSLPIPVHSLFPLPSLFLRRLLPTWHRSCPRYQYGNVTHWLSVCSDRKPFRSFFELEGLKVSFERGRPQYVRSGIKRKCTSGITVICQRIQFEKRRKKNINEQKINWNPSNERQRETEEQRSTKEGKKDEKIVLGVKFLSNRHSVLFFKFQNEKLRRNNQTNQRKQQQHTK